ncbi:MAG: hypothetical protein ACYDAQ_14655 [Mycobacteriales bacterium]
MSPPAPAVLDQARRNIALQVGLLEEFGAVSAAELAELTRSRALRPATVVDNWRRAGKIVAVRWHGDTLVPGFLVTDDAVPDPVAKPALRILHDQGFSDWQAALWWVVPARALDGARPVDLLLEARRADPPSKAATGERLPGGAGRRRDWF